MSMNPIGPAWLEQRLAQGKVIVIDGAMGTELESRGVAMHEKVWSAAALISDPPIIRQVHADYIRAGAEVIITNTFASARHMLAPVGFGEQVEALNRRAVDLANQARAQAAAHPVAIAGSICEWVHPDTPWADTTRLRESLREQAGILAEAGVDLLTIEMGNRLPHTAIAVEEALATGLPVWAGLSCRQAQADGALVGFDPPHHDFAQLVASVTSQPVGLITIMHSSIADTPAGIECVRQQWPGPIGVYPESGYFKMPNWEFRDIISPEDLVTEARTWLAQGVQLLGGCCGLSVAHIQALHEAFAAG